jgi:hypothetical protein
MALADPPPLYTAVPTIEVDGNSYPLIAANLEHLRVTEGLGGLSSLEVALTDEMMNADGSTSHAASAGSPLRLGAGIRVFAGPAEVKAREIFDGQITAIESEIREAGAPLFTILAEDRLFAARRKRRTRLFEASTVKDVVNAIAKDHRLTAEVLDGVEGAASNWLQADETDLAFLRRVLTRWDADVQIVGDRMQVGRIGKDQRALVTLAAGTSLKAARITADMAEQVSGIRLASFDPKTGKAVDAKAECGGLGPGRGKTGADLLAEKFAKVTMHLGRFGPLSDAAAKSLAKCECDRRARAFVTVTGTALGNAELRVGSWVELVGVNKQFENEYAVTRAVHRWDLRHGYLTDFEAQSAYLGEAA